MMIVISLTPRATQNKTLIFRKTSSCLTGIVACFDGLFWDLSKQDMGTQNNTCFEQNNACLPNMACSHVLFRQSPKQVMETSHAMSCFDDLL